MVNNQRKKYNIGSFIGAIQEEAHGVDFDSVRDAVDLCHQANGKPLEEVMDKGRCIVDSVLDPESQVELIRKFLRSTANEMLQRLKWRIEGCRRALLDDMLTVTHRHQPLIQVELPDSDDHEAIRRVSETQLRGYVMLVGAKLPLITNIQHYLDDVIGRLKQAYEYKSVERLLSFLDLAPSWTQNRPRRT